MNNNMKYRIVIIFLILTSAIIFREKSMSVFSDQKYPNPKGILKLLVIPVEFIDVGPSVSLNFIQNNLHDMNSYLREVSYEKVSLEANMSEERIKLSYSMSYYGRDSKKPGDDRGGNSIGSLQLVYDTIRQLDSSTDFSDYTYFVIVHSGEDQAAVSPESLDDNVWSHSYWGLSIPTSDGVSVTRASIVSENSPLGVWIHEYLHQLGELPDLWSKEEEEHMMGVWSPMDIGVALGVPRGSSPPHLSSWSKSKMNWLEPVILPLNDTIINIAPLESMVSRFNLSAMFYLPDETYYFIEVRERVGFDSHLPDEGVIIYHVDERGVEPKVHIVTTGDDDKLKLRAAFHPGDSFFDEFYNLNIEVVSRSFDGYEIHVSVEQKSNIVIEAPYRVLTLQPFSLTVKVIGPSLEPKLNFFVDEILYKTAYNQKGGNYKLDVQFGFHQVGEHVVRAIVVDPELGTRYEAARHIYVEMPETWMTATFFFIILSIISSIIFMISRFRRSTD